MRGGCASHMRVGGCNSCTQAMFLEVCEKDDDIFRNWKTDENFTRQLQRCVYSGKCALLRLEGRGNEIPEVQAA